MDYVFDNDERRLIESVNLKKRVLKEARKKLTHGVDWVRKGGLVLYSGSGIQKLLTHLGVSPSPTLDLDKKKTVAAASAPGPTLQATCIKKFPNTRLVEARIGEETVRVRVRDSKNITLKMVLPVRLTSDGSGMYELTRKAPRFVGRW